MIDLPLPPVEFRHLVGPTEPAAFDAPTVNMQLEELPPDVFASVFDFGCGCGRLARQMMLRGRLPLRYLGIDPHKFSFPYQGLDQRLIGPAEDPRVVREILT